MERIKGIKNLKNLNTRQKVLLGAFVVGLLAIGGLYFLGSKEESLPSTTPPLATSPPPPPPSEAPKEPLPSETPNQSDVKPQQTQTQAQMQTQTQAPMQTQTQAPMQTQTPTPMQTPTSTPTQIKKDESIDLLFLEYAKKGGKGREERERGAGVNLPNPPPLPPYKENLPPLQALQELLPKETVQIKIYGITCQVTCEAITNLGVLKVGDQIGNEKVIAIDEKGITTNERFIPF